MVLTGPTGVGKTDLAVRLADFLAAQNCRIEIVSADALSVYRELEIGTAKPPISTRRRIVHHLMDVTSIAAVGRRTAGFSAGDFSRKFTALIPRLPDPILVVGGTGFYIDAVVRGLADNPPASAEIRDRLMVEDQISPGSLFDRLRKIDPAAAMAIGPANRQRIVRALEVCEITARPFSQSARRRPAFAPDIFVLEMDRARLLRLIEDRTRRMFDGGLPEEVDRLLRSFPVSLPAFSAIGYAEAVLLVTGRIDKEEAVDRTCRRTRQLAKRQLTWWRHFRYERKWMAPADLSPEDLWRRWKECDACGGFSSS